MQLKNIILKAHKIWKLIFLWIYICFNIFFLLWGGGLLDDLCSGEFSMLEILWILSWFDLLLSQRLIKVIISGAQEAFLLNILHECSHFFQLYNMLMIFFWLLLWLFIMNIKINISIENNFSPILSSSGRFYS